MKFCPECGTPNNAEPRYCRTCGKSLSAEDDPAKLNGHAIAKFIIGDAFVLPAVLLMAVESTLQSVLWILLAIPGLLLYTWAIADLLKARAIKLKNNVVPAAKTPGELGAPALFDMPADFADRRAPASVTDRTTRDLA